MLPSAIVEGIIAINMEYFLFHTSIRDIDSFSLLESYRFDYRGIYR